MCVCVCVCVCVSRDRERQAVGESETKKCIPHFPFPKKKSAVLRDTFPSPSPFFILLEINFLSFVLRYYYSAHMLSEYF